MPAQALSYYQDRFHTLVSAPGWNDFVDENGSVTQFLDPGKFGPFLQQQNDSIATLIKTIGLAEQ
jgi:putative tricarboxylic transport membrane protein